MIKPPVPSDEKRRLETLSALNILDTAAEERFDRVTRLAKKIFRVKIALVSLVDAHRQWFKSRQGLDASETSREVSFCGHAINERKTLVVKDATQDERFRDNPLVIAEPNIRFYAGYPLSAPDGSMLGALCVIDDKPREMSQQDLGVLAELGHMIEEELATKALMRLDSLTGLSNRLGFALVAQYLLSFCDRNFIPVSLTGFKIDNFYDVASQYGPDEADRMAAQFSQMLISSFRGSDIVGRVRTDVFAVMFAGTNLQNIERATQALRRRLKTRGQDRYESYGIEIEIFSVSYDLDRHADADHFIKELEARIGMSTEVPSAKRA